MTLGGQFDSGSLKGKHMRRKTGPNKNRDALRGTGSAELADVTKL